jgi:calcineurin-like phosphoesterase
MSYNDYVVHLVGAVQEQQKHINVLEEREKVWVEYSRQQEKAFADFKAQTTAQVEKLAKLIQQLMPK